MKFIIHSKRYWNFWSSEINQTEGGLDLVGICIKNVEKNRNSAFKSSQSYQIRKTNTSKNLTSFYSLNVQLIMNF